MRLTRLQIQTLRVLQAKDPAWGAVVENTARALERKALVELRRTPQGWAECRLTPAGHEAASTAHR